MPDALETDRMRVTGLEEHFVKNEVLENHRSFAPSKRDLAFAETSEGETAWRLLDVDEHRIAAMDATGVDVQVLSLTTPGVQNLAAPDAVRLAASSNDFLAQTVAAHPDRFQGLAILPTASPSAAAAELERAVVDLGLDGAMLFGRTHERNMDHPSFWPIYELAASRRIPLHLHPQSPPGPVREAYYSGFSTEVNAELATIGVGWHFDAGVQFLRLIVAGVFDRYPDLQMITGHWGELMFFFVERLEHLAHAARLPRPILDYVRSNLYVAPSGILSQQYMNWALQVAGPERILFSTDYPFTSASKGGARSFLEALELPELERSAIASRNWDLLRSRIIR